MARCSRKKVIVKNVRNNPLAKIMTVMTNGGLEVFKNNLNLI